jgi:hypothetical protein
LSYNYYTRVDESIFAHERGSFSIASRGTLCRSSRNAMRDLALRIYRERGSLVVVFLVNLVNQRSGILRYDKDAITHACMRYEF